MLRGDRRFTLFPEAFAWFERQRHVANAPSRGIRLGYVNYRDHTPLSAGQVDDTPFGGGAGMVLRVDVVEAALRARYGGDPVTVARAAARDRADARRAGCSTTRWSTSSRREQALTLLSRPLRGVRPADHRPLRHRRGVDRPLRARRRRAGRDGACADAVLRKLPGALGHPGLRARGVLQRRRSAARPSTRTTRGRPSIAAGGSPTCCCRATTRGSANGGCEQSAARARALTHAPSAPQTVRYHRRARGTAHAL